MYLQCTEDCLINYVDMYLQLCSIPALYIKLTHVLFTGLPAVYMLCMDHFFKHCVDMYMQCICSVEKIALCTV